MVLGPTYQFAQVASASPRREWAIENTSRNNSQQKRKAHCARSRFEDDQYGAAFTFGFS
jgi:hypothetical protein